MVFACQRNSFLKEFTSTVLSCTPAELKTVTNGKKQSVKGYEVVLDDTILFPEGGGQPCDYGRLDSVPVLQVSRRGRDAVHFVEASIEVGRCVSQTLDWERRLDHMQQHSGQHLITAFATSLYGYETTAWWLGEEVSHIELDTPSMSSDEIEKLEKVVNEKIREGTPVTVREYSAQDPVLKEIRTRGLPEDVTGNVRVVTIETVESDMCCGTHVSNLCQLQVIKLLGAEKGKKGKVNLQFLVGSRVLKRMNTMLRREQALSAILNNGPDVHTDLVDRLLKTSKTTSKNLQNVLKEIAVAEVSKIKETVPRPKFYSLHRKEADSDFIQTFIREIGDTETLLFLTVGEDKGPCQMVLYGNEKYIANFGAEVCALLEGKGNGKGTKFQAKINSVRKRAEADKLITERIEELCSEP